MNSVQKLLAKCWTLSQHFQQFTLFDLGETATLDVKAFHAD